MTKIDLIFWRKVTNADFFNVERGQQVGPRTGGGQLYFSISFGSHLAHAELGAFLGIRPPDVVRTTRPAKTIDVHALASPKVVAPLEFRPRYRPPQRGDRYYIARQNRRRANGERHPAWMPDSGFPSAPADISGKNDPSIPDLSQLKILVLRASDGSYHATFVNTRRHPPALPGYAEILFRPNALCPADGIVHAGDNAVSLSTWRFAIAGSRTWSREGLPTTPDIEDAVDSASRAAGARASGQGFRSSWPERRAIEQRAMDVVTDHLKDDDWSVRDVSSDHSYDLHCKKPGQVLRIEVKGTTGDGSAVLLTRNEVMVAREEHPQTALAIVSEIELDTSGDAPLATGGSLRMISPWQPDTAGDLHPIGFRYLLHPE